VIKNKKSLKSKTMKAKKFDLNAVNQDASIMKPKDEHKYVTTLGDPTVCVS